MSRQRKRECWEVFAVWMTVPQYLDWSSTPITFNRDDHLDHIVSPSVYPLIIDPIIINI
jgi:hypothetical protein